MGRKFTCRQLAEALGELTAGLHGKELSEAIAVFVRFLVRHRRLYQAGQIIAEYEKVADRRAGIQKIAITSARELDPGTIEKIKRVFGEKVVATTEKDSSLLGGVVIRSEDKIFDVSLKRQLFNLKKQLTK